MDFLVVSIAATDTDTTGVVAIDMFLKQQTRIVSYLYANSNNYCREICITISSENNNKQSNTHANTQFMPFGADFRVTGRHIVEN